MVSGGGDGGGCGEGWGCSSLLGDPYSCGWVLYILFYLHVLYSLPTPGDIPEGKTHMSQLPWHMC